MEKTHWRSALHGPNVNRTQTFSIGTNYILKVTVAWLVLALDGKQGWTEEDLSGTGRFLRAFGAIGPDN